jgi:selenocysteine lyase/cysteine desulfurase
MPQVQVLTESNRGEFFQSSLLNRIRERFVHVEEDPISGKRIFLKNAGGSLTLKAVVEKTAFLAGIPDNAGRPNPTSAELETTIREGQNAVADLIGVKSGTIVQGESSTALLFRILDAIARAAPGTNVIRCSTRFFGSVEVLVPLEISVPPR